MIWIISDCPPAIARPGCRNRHKWPARDLLVGPCFCSLVAASNHRGSSLLKSLRPDKSPSPAEGLNAMPRGRGLRGKWCYGCLGRRGACVPDCPRRQNVRRRALAKILAQCEPNDPQSPFVYEAMAASILARGQCLVPIPLCSWVWVVSHAWARQRCREAELVKDLIMPRTQAGRARAV